MTNPLSPTPEEIAIRRHVTGRSDTEEELSQKADRESKRITAVSPEDWAELSAAVERAQAELDAAHAAARTRREAIESIETAIYELGIQRRRISQFAAIVEEARQPARIASEAVTGLWDNFCAESVANQSRFQICATRLAQVSALKPFLESRLAAEEKKASASLEEIKAAAVAANVSLVDLLKLMKADAHKVTNGSPTNVDLIRIFESGYLSDLLQ